MADNNTTLKIDFYEHFYTSNLHSPLTVFLYLFGLLTGIVGPISVIWFERNCGNRYRTVINQMLATTSWYFLLYTLLIYIPDGIRFVYGPFGELFCDIHVVTQNVLWPCLILTEDVMILLWYIFIFYMKNFGIINDDLIAWVLNLSILLISIWASALRRFSPGRFPLYYYLCTGQDPNDGYGTGHYLTITPKYNAGRIIMVFSLILHLLTVPRLLYNQVYTKMKEKPIRIGIFRSNNEQNSNNQNADPGNGINPLMHQKNNVALFGFMVQLIVLGCLLGFGIGIRNAIKVEPNEWNNENKQWIPLMFLIYAPVAVSVTALTLVFAQNSRLRGWIRRNLQFIIDR